MPAAIVTIIGTILSFIFGGAYLYYLFGPANKPKIAYCSAAFFFIFLIITLQSNAIVKAQNQRIYTTVSETETIEKSTICFKDGSIYNPNYYANISLIEQSREGFYRFHIFRYSKEGTRIVPIVISTSETDEPVIDPNCRQPTVTEYILHKTKLDPDGAVSWKESETRYILTIPPNAIKKVDSFKGS